MSCTVNWSKVNKWMSPSGIDYNPFTKVSRKLLHLISRLFVLFGDGNNAFCNRLRTGAQVGSGFGLFRRPRGVERCIERSLGRAAAVRPGGGAGPKDHQLRHIRVHMSPRRGHAHHTLLYARIAPGECTWCLL